MRSSPLVECPRIDDHDCSETRQTDGRTASYSNETNIHGNNIVQARRGGLQRI